jgi:hypothetical protein
MDYYSNAFKPGVIYTSIHGNRLRFLRTSATKTGVIRYLFEKSVNGRRELFILTNPEILRQLYPLTDYHNAGTDGEDRYTDSSTEADTDGEDEGFGLRKVRKISRKTRKSRKIRRKTRKSRKIRRK